MGSQRWDTRRAAVVPGDGVVARFEGLTCVASCPDPAVLGRLLEICRDAAGPEPGRTMARRLAMWLGAADAPQDDLVFGTVAATGDGMAVFLLGAVSVRRGDLLLSGADAAAWTDRLLPAADDDVELVLDGTPAYGGAAYGLLDLCRGVVPGGGVVLTGTGELRGEQAADLPEQSWAEPPAPVPVEGDIAADPTLVGDEAAHRRIDLDKMPAEEPASRGWAEESDLPARAGTLRDEPTSYREAQAPAAPPVPPAVATPRRFEAILGVPPEEPERAPLEAGAPVGTGSRSVSANQPGAGPTGPKPGEARGHLCSRGHLNDPRSHFCVLCGIRMNERTGVLVIGARPPLGLLVFDDGATYTVDAEYLVGRMPESDDRVRDGSLRSIVVEDRAGAVSRAHAEVRVDGWDVVLVDRGSRNGTFVAAPGDPTWTALPAGQSWTLVPGTRVRLGGRTFVFESPSGVR